MPVFSQTHTPLRKKLQTEFDIHRNFLTDILSSCTRIVPNTRKIIPEKIMFVKEIQVFLCIFTRRL